MNKTTLDKIISKGLNKFSEDLNSFVLRSIADKSSPLINSLDEYKKDILPEIFTAIINTYDQLNNLNTFVDQVFKYDSEIKPLEIALENCSTQIIATKEEYNRIKTLSNNCQNYSSTLLNNVARAMQLSDPQRGESWEIIQSNKSKALSELSKISFTPVIENNFEELCNAISTVREKYLYNKGYSQPTWSLGAQY